jgi:hypothetical protein
VGLESALGCRVVARMGDVFGGLLGCDLEFECELNLHWFDDGCF